VPRFIEKETRTGHRERLSLSEKPVRNRISNAFDKLGVWSRAEAILLGRDRHSEEISHDRLVDGRQRGE
jgi:hypothetical protein